MTMPTIAILGIDLGKKAIVLRRRITRGVVAFTAALPPYIVAMEVCCGAHFLGRSFVAHAQAA